MTNAYFDATAFVKLLFDEEGSDIATRLWDGSDVVVSSRLSHPEVSAALAEVARLEQVTPRVLRQVRRTWRDYWAATRIVELTEMVERAAERIIDRTPLRSIEAVHLASALAMGDPDLVVVTWDEHLGSAAATAGLRHAPAGLA